MNMLTNELYRTFSRFGVAKTEISYTFYGTGCQMVIKPGYNIITVNGLKAGIIHHIGFNSRKEVVCSGLPLGIHTVTITT